MLATPANDVAVTTPVILTFPLTSSFAIGLVVPIPTNSVAPNGANWIVPSASTSIEGIPETSLTEKILPEVRLFVIENNWPAEPSKLKVPLLWVS